jgi:hypothetical protein
MPISEYFKGKGEQVMHDMESRYGAKKGKSVFYATATKDKLTPQGSAIKKRLAAKASE